jgi:hypothetical protein
MILCCKIVSSFLFLSFFTACASSSRSLNTSPAGLTLKTADGIQIGVTRLSDLEERFGKPSLALDIPASQQRALLYCDKQPCVQGHLTFHIDKDTGIVRAVIWSPETQDKEQTLADLLVHYQEMKFDKQTLLYNYGDYFNLVETYKNTETGITISYNPDKKIINQVYREDPKSPEPIAVSSSKLPIITVLPDRDTAGAP